MLAYGKPIVAIFNTIIQFQFKEIQFQFNEIQFQFNEIQVQFNEIQVQFNEIQVQFNENSSSIQFQCICNEIQFKHPGLNIRESVSKSFFRHCNQQNGGTSSGQYKTRTADYGLGIKHGLGYKTRSKHYGLGIKYGLWYKTRTEHYGLFSAYIASRDTGEIACRKILPMHVTLKASIIRSQDKDCKYILVLSREKLDFLYERLH